tara:strand:+ start:1248 stop:1430 length:183 start_codon:yes stop_codon:yes gene_type:complete
MAYPTDPMYKFIKDSFTNTTVAVRKSCGKDILLDIPIDEANTDYQEYLEWAKNNTAEEAD